MRRFPFASLRARLIMLVFLAVVPALGLILWHAGELRRAAAVQGQGEALRLVRLAASEQDLLVEGTRQLLVVLEQLPAVNGGEAAECSALFADLCRAYPVYANLGVVQLDGSAWCSAIPITQPVSAADRTWFKRAVQTRHFVVGDVQIGRVTGKLTVNFGYPVLDEDGQVRGVLFAALDLDWLNRLVAKGQLPPDSTLTVMDRDGTILARYPDAETWSRPTLPVLVILRAVQTGAEGIVEVPGPDGVTRLHAFKTLESTPEGDIHVIISIPTEVVFAEVGRMLTRSLAALGMVTALAFAAAWLGGSIFILRPVRALLGVTQRLRAGDLSARTVLRYGVEELSQLARAFHEMSAELEQGAAQRRLLLAKLVRIQDEERARIARDMHDGVLQLITAARYELRAAKIAVESGSPVTAQERFNATREVLDEMEKEIRQAIYDLHPPILDGRGLIPALRRYASSFRGFSGLSCEVKVKGAPMRLPSPVELGVFRMVEEALRNVATHGQARTASVTLDFRPTMLYVTVQDDGQGFDYEQVMTIRNAEHLGLISIRERSESFGGKMEVRSKPGHGTSVTFWLPIQAGES